MKRENPLRASVITINIEGYPHGEEHPVSAGAEFIDALGRRGQQARSNWLACRSRNQFGFEGLVVRIWQGTICWLNQHRPAHLEGTLRHTDAAAHYLRIWPREMSKRDAIYAGRANFTGAAI